MSRRLRWGVPVAAALLLAVLLWLSQRGARTAPAARDPVPLPEARGLTGGPELGRAARNHAPLPPAAASLPGVHAPPASADELMPRPEAIPPKDPDGPARDWRDFTEDERAAVSGMELDMADMGDVIQRLESGAEIERLRGAPVTAEEQRALRAELDAFAAVYEQGYDRYYTNQATIIDMADAVREARARLDHRVREIYGLTDDQFFELFPYRRDLVPAPAPQ